MQTINNAFVGLMDIASLIKEYHDGLLGNGIQVTSAIFKRNHIAQSSSATYDLTNFPRPFYRGVRPRILQTYLQDHWNLPKNRVFKKIFTSNDLFLFIDSSFYTDYSDIIKIKRAGKKIISIFTGDDCRWYGAMKQEFEKYGMQVIDYPEGYDFSNSSMERRLSYLRYCEKYSDAIFSLPNQAQLALRPYFSWRLPLNVDKLPVDTNQNSIPRIIHAPTSRAFKGTRYIIDAIERLKGDGIKFDFELVEGLSNEAAIQKYLHSDIIISQVMCPSGGRLALEGLAMGKIVLSKMGFDSGYDEKFPAPCPIIDVSPSTIYQQLKEIIPNLEFRKRRAIEGPAYIRDNFNPTKVVAAMLNTLNNTSSVPDFYPNFFRDQFVPENREAAEIYNKWNRFVSNCPWYAETVGSCNRDGLNF